MTTPQGAFTTDFDGMDGIDVPADPDGISGDFSGLMVDRIDPTAQSLGAAYDQAQAAIMQATAGQAIHTAGVAPDGRVDRVS